MCQCRMISSNEKLFYIFIKATPEENLLLFISLSFSFSDLFLYILKMGEDEPSPGKSFQ